MKLRFAIPQHPIFNVFHSRPNQEIDIFLVEEKKCIELISSKKVDAAILSPYGYSKGVAVSDYRIIPGPILALKGYTGFSSAYFRSDLTNIFNSLIDNPDDFISIASKILFSEKYDIALLPKILKNDIDIEIKNSDVIISSKESKENTPILDISEDWFDTFEFPLILGFWVINSDFEGTDFLSIINSLTDPTLPSEEFITEIINENEARQPRTGSIIRKWNPDIEPALEETIRLLYYHQFIKEIAAVKLLGRD